MAEKPKVSTEYDSQLEWIKFREQSLGAENVFPERGTSKLFEKMRENPFVPIGALATFAALSYGLWCFRLGKARESQIMMRMRIGAQGFTIVALLAGILVAGKNPKSPR